MLQGFKPLLRLQSKILRNSRAASTVVEQIDFASRHENITQPVKLLTDAESFRFQSYLPQILEDIGSLPGVESMPDITEWLNETIQAIVTHGDFIAAHQTILAYKYLSQDQGDFDLAIVNGWAIELGLRGHEILEDVIDDTKVRNGKDTRHCRNKHGVAAVCDGILVRSCTALLSQKYFKTKSYYSDMITLRNFNTHSQLYGKSLVLRNAKERQFHLYKLDFYL
ncbi:unnamed protein product [Allacma fusca]|uniref:Uncharacterized protein n=1 Tax=Allacma fusca TaxID=39272 RepID=A0A8J2JKX7_9HEXA|nr:unnamed protein product [Allacma fusca]